MMESAKTTTRYKCDAPKRTIYGDPFRLVPSVKLVTFPSQHTHKLHFTVILTKKKEHGAVTPLSLKSRRKTRQSTNIQKSPPKVATKKTSNKYGWWSPTPPNARKRTHTPPPWSHVHTHNAPKAKTQHKHSRTISTARHLPSTLHLHLVDAIVSLSRPAVDPIDGRTVTRWRCHRRYTS